MGDPSPWSGRDSISLPETQETREVVPQQGHSGQRAGAHGDEGFQIPAGQARW